MKIVLLDDLVNVGEAGEIVDVKNGYARNWLIPQRLAERATADAINRINLIKRAADAKRAKRMEEAAGKFHLLADKTLAITMKAGTESRLFGAVTSAMIADEVQIQFDIDLDRRHVMLEEPIKQLGEYTVPLRASADVTGEIKLVVEPEVSKDELEAKLIEEARRQEEEERAAAEAALTGDEGAEATTEEAGAEEAAEAIEKYEEHEEAAPAPTEEP